MTGGAAVRAGRPGGGAAGAGAAGGRAGGRGGAGGQGQRDARPPGARAGALPAPLALLCAGVCAAAHVISPSVMDWANQPGKPALARRTAALAYGARAAQQMDARAQGVAPAPAPQPLFFVPPTQRTGATPGVSTSAATFNGQGGLLQGTLPGDAYPVFAG